MSLHRPFTRGQWPPHFGGVGFPPSRGKYSLAWQKKLAESGAPMWPDPDDPACHGEPEVLEPVKDKGPKREFKAIFSTCPGKGEKETIGYIPEWITEAWPQMLTSAGKRSWDLDVWPPTQARSSIMMDHIPRMSHFKGSNDWVGYRMPDRKASARVALSARHIG